MKKTLAILMAALMLLGLTACSSAPEVTTEPAATAEQTEQTAAPAEEKQSYTVGICQLGQHPALDAATQGFKDVLTEQLGDSVTIEEGNASNDIPTCAPIVNGFVSSEVDLIMAKRHSCSSGGCSGYQYHTHTGHFRYRVRRCAEYFRLLRHRGRQRIRHLRSGSSGSAGGNGKGAVPRCKDGGHTLLLRRA